MQAISQHDAQVLQDSLATVLRLMQQHINQDSSVERHLPSDGVLVAIASGATTVLVAAIGALATIFSKKIERINTKVNGQLDRALNDGAAVRAELASLERTGTEGALREIASLRQQVAELAGHASTAASAAASVAQTAVVAGERRDAKLQMIQEEGVATHKLVNSQREALERRIQGLMALLEAKGVEVPLDLTSGEHPIVPTPSPETPS
jgi:hypothetical protein